MSENSVVVVALVAIAAIVISSLVALVVSLIYFTEKKVSASWKIKAGRENSKVETDLNIQASEQQKS